MRAPTLYSTPFGEFELRRHPARPEEPLQAWCAADSLLLEEVHRLGVQGRDILVVNDSHGALCVALQPSALWTDSALSAIALRQNAARNGCADIPLAWCTAQPPTANELVVMRVPRQLPYLEYQLATLAQVLPTGARLLAAGMDKYLSPRTAQLIEQYVGPTERHRGQRKARLFSAQRDDRSSTPPASGAQYFCESLGDTLWSGANVFSRDAVDIGSRLLLSQLERLAEAELLLDLACGNGILGLCALRAGLARRGVFCDESAMAVASARRNAQHLFTQSMDGLSFLQGDGTAGYSGEPPDLILCNPPFHLEGAVDDFAGRRLLRDCAPRLAPGGRLCLVANRHLDYRPVLKHEFTRYTQLAQNSKFRVLLAYRD